MQKLKHIAAYFFLLVFLFPLAGTEVHNFSHRNEFHCTADKAVHFHEAEHNCTLCDYSNQLSVSPVFNYQQLLLCELGHLSFFFSEANYLLQQKDFLSLRAPPSLV